MKKMNSKRTRSAFREAFTKYSVRSDIIDIFRSAGLDATNVKEGQRGRRKDVVDEFYDAVEWRSEPDEGKVLDAWEEFLGRLSRSRQWEVVEELDDQLHEEGLCFENNEIVNLDAPPSHGSFVSEGVGPVTRFAYSSAMYLKLPDG